MRVLVQPADIHGCGQYRLIMAAEHLRSEGHDVIVAWPFTGKNGFEVMIEEGTNRMLDFRLPYEGVDVIVMQRISHALHTQAVPLLREHGIAVVIDMDDNLTCIHPKNTAFWNYRTKSSTPFSHKNADQVCRDATLVTVSTRDLMKVYAKHDRGMVIDNYVPERYLYVNHPHEDGPVFGWGGTYKSHPVDLLVLGRSVRELVDEGRRFKIIGPGEPELIQQLRLDPSTTETSGVVDMFNWPTALSELDVGIAPLEASTFNTGKSRLKPLEYASLGIPCVASPRAEYNRFYKESGGACLLADTPKQWATNLRQLLTDDTRRKEMAEQCRTYAATQTIELNSWRWLEAWTRAYDIQRGKK
jgi:glycosyltransferase involved in cell wall biosynthesis